MSSFGRLQLDVTAPGQRREDYSERVLDASRLHGDRELSADVVVVGTGAGGAPAALQLVQAGLKVVALEAGSYFPLQALEQDLVKAARDIYWDHGNLSTEDGSLRVTAGRAVGGSTVIHMLTMNSIPGFTLKRWRERHGLSGFEEQTLAPLDAYLRQMMQIAPITWEHVNHNARVYVKGCEALGLSWHLNERNGGTCVGSGRCHLGCPFGGKVSMDVAFVPRALDAGLQLLTNVWVDRVESDAGRASGVVATVREPRRQRAVGKLRVRAKRVLLAGGALQTPVLLLRSGLQTPEGHVGRQLFAQPGVFVLGDFADEIKGWEGITNPVHIDHWMHPDKGGYFCEPGMLNASILAASVPGLGGEHCSAMSRFSHFAASELLLSDAGTNDVAEASHRVTIDDAGRVQINYVLTERDRGRLRSAIRSVAELLFAAGAQRVYFSHRHAPALTSPAELDALRHLPLGPNDILLNSVHPQGSCPTSKSKQAGVVNERAEHHHVANLFVGDASAFPDGIGTNTTLAAATFGLRAAHGVLDSLA
jgi:choline dehydrogenase-like flavoprotein